MLFDVIFKGRKDAKAKTQPNVFSRLTSRNKGQSTQKNDHN